ncbi:hypothetical protein MCA0757 [Methylococcus capsulatus str. Bath]|jgi:hypothetical protein|uniref:Uncharacterized protein n=1 Tax=Methylococcus capsulatus (strain ATCC 33009 / NCIMB 11132 / Bath) TaxID=243233 RepID=Q60AT7_METCA|nr:hypothetical protein [Methylococcus capsulatus]AAU92979.1 hypothetical protein MCA0757 [Methylococcus capsulatus str. Bath]
MTNGQDGNHQGSPGHGLLVTHAVPGRIRLKSERLKGRPQEAEQLTARLSKVAGIHHAAVNPATGSITLHYRSKAVESLTFFAELAAALGLIAVDIEAGDVEGLFALVGLSPADAVRSLWGRRQVPAAENDLAYDVLRLLGAGIALGVLVWKLSR